LQLNCKTQVVFALESKIPHPLFSLHIQVFISAFRIEAAAVISFLLLTTSSADPVCSQLLSASLTPLALVSLHQSTCSGNLIRLPVLQSRPTVP